MTVKDALYSTHVYTTDAERMQSLHSMIDSTDVKYWGLQIGKSQIEGHNTLTGKTFVSYIPCKHFEETQMLAVSVLWPQHKFCIC